MQFSYIAIAVDYIVISLCLHGIEVAEVDKLQVISINYSYIIPLII